MANRPASGSPLRKFVVAKDRMCGIFKNIEKYVQDSIKLLHELRSERIAIAETCLEEVKQFLLYIRMMEDVLLRDKMKVVFFGRTSSGKSTVINAMLHSKILPSGMGHTTRCFVQVEGSQDSNKMVLTDDSNETKSIDSLDGLTHALCSKEMGEDNLIRITWPKVDSKLLQNEVILLDSPGVDVSPQFDVWIDKHCLDADVFVLVSNAESTLAQAEKNFFHRVNDKLSRPNIFILNNRWDASALESEFSEKVREQHVAQFTKFLVHDLAVYSTEDAKNRIFFVSAKEVLYNRLKMKDPSIMPGYNQLDGFQARLLEFEDFERQFELCISQSAMQTKFESYLAKGKHLTTRVYEILENVHLNIMKERDEASNALHEKIVMLAECQKNYENFMKKEKAIIQQLAAEVQLKVSAECYDEIACLGNVINTFHKEFIDDPLHIHLYKQHLMCHVDEIVTSELQLRCTGGLLQRIIGKEKQMVDGAATFLPDAYESIRLSLLQHREPFKFSFTLHCQSLFSDFQEDLSFSFSLGIRRLIAKVIRTRRHVSNRNSQWPTNSDPYLFCSSSLISCPGVTSSPDSPPASDINGITDHSVLHCVAYTNAMYVANGGIGVLIIGGFIYKRVGWRYIAFGISLYLLLYLYERLSWNGRTKENALKYQMRRHLCYKLYQQLQSISMNCENQVIRELTEVLNRIQELASKAHDELKAKITESEAETKRLDAILKSVVQTKYVSRN